MSQAMQRKPQVRHDPSERGLTPARSQIMGAVVGRIGMALHEETVIDHRNSRFNNHNFAEYHVPVNADVYDIEVIFVDARKPHLDSIGVKSIGEIGIVGTGGYRYGVVNEHIVLVDAKTRKVTQMIN